ncbi:hypothetical protein GMMP13_1160004 [Candidatus Magnetomoraceae bacterium gMMP-13]
MVLYEKLNRIETSAKNQVANQEKIIAIGEEILQANQDNQETKQWLAGKYGNMSWYLLFDRQFTKAGEFASKGLALDPSQEWMKTNLASSYLFTGKFEKAKAIYFEIMDKTYNDKTFREVFLEDFSEFEKAGITHPDMEKARKLLSETQIIKQK